MQSRGPKGNGVAGTDTRSTAPSYGVIYRIREMGGRGKRASQGVEATGRFARERTGRADSSAFASILRLGALPRFLLLLALLRRRRGRWCVPSSRAGKPKRAAGFLRRTTPGRLAETLSEPITDTAEQHCTPQFTPMAPRRQAKSLPRFFLQSISQVVDSAGFPSTPNERRQGRFRTNHIFESPAAAAFCVSTLVRIRCSPRRALR